MLGIPYKAIKTFKWSDLDGKYLKIAVASANPECLEFFEQVWGLDVETGQIYLLFEKDMTPASSVKE